MNKNNKRAFTLIELIVVIAVLAILAMLIVPSLSGYIKRAKETTYDVNARICYDAAVSAQALYDVGMIDNMLEEINEVINGEDRPGGRCLVSHEIEGSPLNFIDLTDTNSEEFAKLSIDKVVWLTGSGEAGSKDSYRGIYSPDPRIKDFFKRQ